MKMEIKRYNHVIHTKRSDLDFMEISTTVSIKACDNNEEPNDNDLILYKDFKKYQEKVSVEISALYNSLTMKCVIKDKQ